MSLITELKRRNVIKVGIAYVVASWLILQLTEVLTELLELEADIGKIVIVLLVVGFVPALIFAWAFEMTPEGLKREKDVDRSVSVSRQTGRKLDFVIIGMLAVIAGYFIWESRFASKGSESNYPPGASPGIEAGKGNSTLTPAIPDARSIAVLPFANRSLLEEDSFFTDGIHDDLLTQLAKIHDLKVVSRTSVMKYKDSEKTIPEIAEELDVATILEGGIQRAGHRVRINAQLIDVANDRHVWAETFDREMTVENIFEIQSEIARQIVRAVRGELTEDEKVKLARVPTNNLEAYEAYLQALALTNRSDYSMDNYIEAEVWAERAVELDPQFAQAWAMLVEIHGQAMWIGYDAGPERQSAAQHALKQAQRFGPDLPETIAAEAEYLYRIEQDFPASAETFKRAHQALPGDVDILYRLALAQRRTTDVEGAIDSFRQTMVLDANHGRAAPTLAETLVNMDRTDMAEQLIDRMTVRYPDARDLRAQRVHVYIQQGDLEAARALLDSMSPWLSSAYFIVATDLPILERDFDLAIRIWETPEVAAMAENRGQLGLREVARAWAHLLGGEPDRARTEAERVIELVTSSPRIGSYTDAFELMNVGIAYWFLGRSEEALAAVNEAVRIVPESRDVFFGSLAAQGRAHVLALVGEREEALAEIERLLNTPYKFSKWRLYLDPRWDFFRDDDRFNALVRPEGLEEGS